MEDRKEPKIVPISPVASQSRADQRAPVTALRWRVAYDVWIVLAMALGLDAMIFVIPHALTPVRFVLGLAVGIFIPGYLSTLALFPETATLDAIERTGLSLVLSVVWIPLLALLLSLAKIRLNAPHLALSVTLVTVLTGAAAVWRRYAAEVPAPPPVYPNGSARWYLGGLALVLGLVTWAIVGPNLRAQHMAFSVLGAHDRLQGYPYHIRFGQIYPLHLEIFNPSNAARNFTAKVVANGVPTRLITARVRPHQTWQHAVDLPANGPARSETVKFLLYARGGRRPLRTLWVRYTIVP